MYLDCTFLSLIGTSLSLPFQNLGIIFRFCSQYHDYFGKRKVTRAFRLNSRDQQCTFHFSDLDLETITCQYIPLQQKIFLIFVCSNSMSYKGCLTIQAGSKQLYFHLIKCIFKYQLTAIPYVIKLSSIRCSNIKAQVHQPNQ